MLNLPCHICHVLFPIEGCLTKQNFHWVHWFLRLPNLFFQQGGKGHYVKPGPTKPDIMVDAIWDAKLCTCYYMDMNEVMFKLVLFGSSSFLESCWFIIMKHGTCAFLTKALWCFKSSSKCVSHTMSRSSLLQLSWATRIQATPLDRSKYHEPNLVILAQHSCVMTSHVTSWRVSYVLQFFRLHFVTCVIDSWSILWTMTRFRNESVQIDYVFLPSWQGLILQTRRRMEKIPSTRSF